MKKLILVTSPPACGKTRLSKRLCTALDHVVYLDKDTLIPLSKQIFKVAGEPYDRSSAFFEANIRDYEYETILDLAFEALRYANTVLINAPFTREIRDTAAHSGMKRRKLSEYGAVARYRSVIDPKKKGKDDEARLQLPLMRENGTPI